jgi:6-phosphogluconolactonase
VTRPVLDVLPDVEAVAARGASLVAEAARAAVVAHGRFAFAVSGGQTPWIMLSRLAHEDVPWSDVAIYQVDERVVPVDDPDRNLTHLRENLRADAIARIRPMPVDAEDLERAADEYARWLPDSFDLVHLGLGPDGHTASLVPGDPVLEVEDRLVAVTAQYRGHRRMTLTFPALAHARRILWLVTGEDKADALARLLAGDASIPAGRVPGENAVVVADEAAAGSANTS